MATYRVEISLTHTHADDTYAKGEAKWLYDVALNRIAVAQHVYPDTALEETPWARIVNVETGETVHAAYLNRSGQVVQGDPA